MDVEKLNALPFVSSRALANKKITEKQRQYCRLVAEGVGQYPAACAVGVSRASTVNWMKLPKIRALIADERAKYAAASQMTKKKVIDGFVEAIDMARLKADPVAMIAGWREVGKMCGFYEPTRAQIEVSVNGKVMIERLNHMTDEQLLALAQGDESALEGEFTEVPQG